MDEHGPACEGCQILALTAERDVLRLEVERLTAHITRRIVRDSIARSEDDFGDGSIQRAMVAARERGEDIENMPNPSRLRGSVHDA